MEQTGRAGLALVYCIFNFYVFHSGHELYRDSPLTIWIVVIDAAFGIIPATWLLILSAISANRIAAVIRGLPTYSSGGTGVGSG